MNTAGPGAGTTACHRPVRISSIIRPPPRYVRRLAQYGIKSGSEKIIPHQLHRNNMENSRLCTHENILMNEFTIIT